MLSALSVIASYICIMLFLHVTADAPVPYHSCDVALDTNCHASYTVPFKDQSGQYNGTVLRVDNGFAHGITQVRLGRSYLNLPDLALPYLA